MGRRLAVVQAVDPYGHLGSGMPGREPLLAQQAGEGGELSLGIVGYQWLAGAVSCS
jgi:hypothetical protein